MVRRIIATATGASLRYALSGFLLGAFAPLGWGLIQTLFFTESGTGWDYFFSHPFQTSRDLALYLYMGLGTSTAFGLFGYIIGSAIFQLQLRAQNLDGANRMVSEQKAEYERRFRDLNYNLKNFHATNTGIQKSLDPRAVMKLAAESLHKILRYDRVNLLLLNKSERVLEFVASCSDAGDEKVSRTLPYDERAGAIYKAISENRFLLVEDVRKLGPEYQLQPPCDNIPQLRSRNFILCPITLGGEAIGAFGVDNKLRRKAIDETDLDTVRLFADQVSTTLTRIRLIEAIENLIQEMERTFERLLAYRQEHTQQLQTLRRATFATSDAIAQIAESAEVVSHAVEDSSSSASELSTAIQEVSSSLGQLATFMERSISAINQISASAQEVEKNASRSQKMSARVKEQAEGASKLVTNAFQGLEGISLAVDRAVATIEFLALKGQEIRNTIKIIHEINSKTNLLSLNASIIASQAGEHGRSFAVVAEEIRKLSLETGGSAGAIESLVHEIGSATQEAVSHIGETRELVDAGIELGRGTGRALKEILDSAVPAMEMTQEILKATQEQVKSSRFVSESIEQLGKMAQQVTAASREQAQAVTRIVQTIEEIKEMSEEMAAVTARNRQESSAVEDAVRAAEELSTRIFEVMEERQREGRALIRQLNQVKSLSESGPVLRGDSAAKRSRRSPDR